MKALLLIALLSIFGKEPSETGITYRTLTWSDFRGAIPDYIPDGGAMTATQIVLDENSDEYGKYHFCVTAYFEPDSSCVRVRTDRVLHHEQTHFKIAFLMAQRCMQELVPLQGGGEAAEKKAGNLFERYLQATDELNIKFDRETNHAINAVAERQWEVRISQQLNQIMHGRNR